MSEQNNIVYSVVIPVYNGDRTLKELNEQLITFFRGKEKPFEIIYVDDRSIDDSWRILNEIFTVFQKEVKIIRFTKNYGQHKATMCGIEESSGKYIITMDDDLEQIPADIDNLLSSYAETKAQLTYGMYSDDKTQSARKILTSLYRLLSKAEGKEKGKGSSFRLITRELADKIKMHSKSFLFIDEMFLWYIPSGAYVNLIKESSKKKSRYSLFKLIRLTFNVILYTTTIPLQLFIFVGFSLAIVNFIVGFFYLLKKLFFNAELGYTSIIVSILFTTGIILIGMGILGIYIARVYNLLNNAPPYNIAEKKC